MDRATHWNQIYQTKVESELSWTQDEPALSLALVCEFCSSGRIIDVGGGRSRLAERLLDEGYDVAVVDISQAALEKAREQLGARAARVEWIQEDITSGLDLGTCDLWHDRAVFHFLMEPADRRKYADLLRRTVRPGGHAVIATFALDGPEKCSGLPVQRYDPNGLLNELGEGLELIKSDREMHRTPTGKLQAFQYSVLRRGRIG